MKNKNLIINFLVGVTFLAMITVNALANILPINGVDTGQVSDSYGNLFAPSGFTFSIWGLIYLLLAGYTLYQFGLFRDKKEKMNSVLIEKVGLYFIITSLANIFWIFSWHYMLMGLTLFFMLVILIFLIKIADLLNKEKLNSKEKNFMLVPFSVYFGWITVATIANVTVFLVSIGWDGFGIIESTWTVIILLAGLAIGTARLIKDKNIAYGLVLVWAYFGIYIKHTSPDGFGGMYSGVITTVVICLLVFLAANAYVFFNRGVSQN